MNTNDAKKILLAYRPGTADAQDAEIAGALAFAQQDADLAKWLEAHCARQELIRKKFSHIKPPLGLKEQIISEHAAGRRGGLKTTMTALLAAVGVVLVVLAIYFGYVARDQAVTSYRNRMVSQALRAYSMKLVTDDAAKIQDYLKQQGAPSDYVLPAGLAKTTLVGCAVQKWQGKKVSMLCFRTGKPLEPGAQSDLWLFVVDQTSLRNAPKPGAISVVTVNKLTTALWTSHDKTYLLGVSGNKDELNSLL